MEKGLVDRSMGTIGSGDASSSLDPPCMHTHNPPIDPDSTTTDTDSDDDAPESLDRSTSHLDLDASANAPRSRIDGRDDGGRVDADGDGDDVEDVGEDERGVCSRETRGGTRWCRWSSERRARETSSMTTERPRTRDRPEPVWMMTTETTETTTTETTETTTTTRCVCRRVLLHSSSSPSSSPSSPSRGRADRSIVITHHHPEGVLSKDGEGGAPRGGREGEREGRAREGRDGWDS
jgi:hypothetical protein